EEIDDLAEMDLYTPSLEEDDDFWEGMEGDLTAAQKKAVELLVNPRGLARYTLTELSSGEVKALATLKAISELIPDPILVNFIKNYVILKRAHKRKGVRELIAIAGGRAWRILQNISLSRMRKVHTTSEGEEW
ncbi:MAG: hypothetical protein GXO43_01285, partial [Crenarchaeota archaeon]|nr:hypothetical protein [Thermoproteota archaeon]